MLVDDQILVLKGLERMLSRKRRDWDVVVVESGHKAQAVLEAERFDILVTDLNMPGYGGAELLVWTRDHRPGIIRVVLSGHQDEAMILASTRTAHRFLNKPCAPDSMLETLTGLAQICELPDVPQGIRQGIVGPGRLPSSSASLQALSKLLAESEEATADLQRLVLEEPALAVKALHLVNAAFYGVPRPLVNPAEAVRLLNKGDLKALQPEPVPGAAEAGLSSIREKHLRIAQWASAITKLEGADTHVQDLAYTAGLLASAGPLLQSTFAGFPGIGSKDSWTVEAAGPRLAALFLSLLGLPQPLVDIIDHHQTPSGAPDSRSLPLAAVHVASGFCDPSFLEGGGFLTRLQAWQDLTMLLQG